MAEHFQAQHDYYREHWPAGSTSSSSGADDAETDVERRRANLNAWASADGSATAGRQGRAGHRRQPRARPGDGAGVRPRRRRRRRSPAASRTRATRSPREVAPDDRAARARARLPRRAGGTSSTRLVDAAYAEFGAVDVLVNNAGDVAALPEPRGGQRGALRQGDRRQPQGPVPAGGARRARAWPRATAARSSTSAASPPIRPRADDLPYAAAKAGLNALTAGFAQAFGPKVRVNTIMAGPFLTDISEAWDLEAFDRRRARPIPLRPRRRAATRSSAPRSTSPATRRASPPARCSASTAGRRSRPVTVHRPRPRGVPGYRAARWLAATRARPRADR